ncbi:spore germination protein [Sulfobacillus thermosulfidooxidans]|uniref:spore germination protein n=1 Tax=Sulfobacillus thermosulfidooxidans TaxID=28034 RepID=UPI0006B68999|nr:spore germination protein [Sulfobacillus thermosulfidooxidans]
MPVNYMLHGKAMVHSHEISRDLKANVQWLKEYLGYKETFDLIVREFKIGSRQVALVYLDSFVSQTDLTLIMQELFKTPDDQLNHPSLAILLNRKIPFIEITPETALDKTADQILAGPAALLVDGITHAIIMDVRKYPDRNPSEPSLERVLRGPKDGFVETLIFNTILIRRRLRDPNLRIEIHEVGRRSRADVALIYIKDIADDYFVRQIRKRIKDINVDALTMSEKALQEWIMHKPWWNPFPNSRFTERPDVAAEHLTEGHVLVMIDTSPNAMILPVSFFSFLQSVEEYHEDVMVGTYLKWVRFLGVALSWFLPPLWYAMLVSHTHLPDGWQTLIHPTVTEIPIFWQLIGAEIGVDLLRLALTFSPDPLTQSMGFFGAILLGDIAVKAKLIDAQVMVFVAIAAVGTFSAPDIDFGMAVRLLRIFLLIMTGVGELVGAPWDGFFLGILIPLIILVTTNSFGMRYSWPVYPLDGSALGSEFIRKPLNRKFLRPSITLPIDKTHRRPKPKV